MPMRCYLFRYLTRQGQRSTFPPPSGKVGTLQRAAKPNHTLRKRSNLSEHGASRAATFVAPHALRSYRATGQTLVSQSPPLPVFP
jgi:hypothetical protein